MSEPPSNPVEPTRKHRILKLDGLRAVSVVLVVAYHCWLYSKTIYVPDGPSWFINAIGRQFLQKKNPVAANNTPTAELSNS